MKELNIDKELRDLIPPLSDDEFKQLEDNIVKEGWRNHERIYTWNGFIIDGHNRYNVCKKNNINFLTEEKQFKNKTEVILWMIENQLGRRNILPYDRVRLNLKKEEILKPLAKENQKNPFGKKVPSEIEGFGLYQPKVSINTRDIIARSANVGKDTVSKVKFIETKADEETKKKLSKGEETINRVYQNLKGKEKREEVLKQAKEPQRLEDKDRKYKIIYADPAWKYFAGGNKNQSLHYSGMEIEDIKKLGVSKLADDDCILFLWVTFPILKEAFEVIEAWGFKYATCGFTWVKKNKSGEGWFFGLGNWTRSNAEICLIATKGSPLRFSASVSQIIDTPIEEHSKKPAIVRDKIVELCGDLPRIELFARQKTPGWDVWGNEIDN